MTFEQVKLLQNGYSATSFKFWGLGLDGLFIRQYCFKPGNGGTHKHNIYLVNKNTCGLTYHY